MRRAQQEAENVNPFKSYTFLLINIDLVFLETYSAHIIRSKALDRPDIDHFRPRRRRSTAAGRRRRR